jgi:uncharacterized damage-inducible protein DinB
MPIASEIATAAQMYRQNDTLLTRSIGGLTPSEFQTRPSDTTNSVFWIVGHTVWSRSMALKFLGSMWTRPWLELFARGAKVEAPEQYPSLDEVLTAWKDVSAALAKAMEEVPSEAMTAAAPEKSPSFDGKIGGMVSFLAYHETYHVGQLAFLRKWLGHEGAVG